MDKPPEPLSEDEIASLQRLARILTRIEGWCLVNRAIAKVLIVGALGLLILFSNALDAVKNLLGLKQ